MKSINRIALIQPFLISGGDYDVEVVRRKGHITEAPLGLGYLSAYLKPRGYEVRVFDANLIAIKGIALRQLNGVAEAERELMARVDEFDPDLVGISCLFHYTSGVAHRLAGLLKKNRIVVMGGAYPTISPEAALNDPNVDFIIMGEGEVPFFNLLEMLNGRRKEGELLAVGNRRNGRTVLNRELSLLNSLDDNPVPDRTDISVEDYHRYGRHFIQRFEEYEGGELEIATLTATRGCVFNCSFCINRKLWRRGLRTRNPENVLREIELLKTKYGVRYLAFNDDNLLINKKFAYELLQGMIQRKLNVHWTTGGMSVRGLDETLVKLAIESGCLVFNLAIESANRGTLERIRKPVNLDEAVRAAEIVKQNGGYLMGLFMLGFPWETEEEFLNTVRFGKSLECDWTLYSLVTPFPGSDLYEECLRDGSLPSDVPFAELNFRGYVLEPAHTRPDFVVQESYFANLEQNFLENPNLTRNPKLALSEFMNVVKLAPDHATAHYCIGRIYERCGEDSLAKRSYSLARESLIGLHKEFFERKGVSV